MVIDLPLPSKIWKRISFKINKIFKKTSFLSMTQKYPSPDCLPAGGRDKKKTHSL
jgi:hypothetical protein